MGAGVTSPDLYVAVYSGPIRLDLCELLGTRIVEIVDAHGGITCAESFVSPPPAVSFYHHCAYGRCEETPLIDGDDDDDPEIRFGPAITASCDNPFEP